MDRRHSIALRINQTIVTHETKDLSSLLVVDVVRIKVKLLRKKSKLIMSRGYKFRLLYILPSSFGLNSEFAHPHFNASLMQFLGSTDVKYARPYLA